MPPPRPLSLTLALTLALTSAVALGGGSASVRRARGRAEADRAIAMILAGEGVQAAVARLEFAGEKLYAADALSEEMKRSLDDNQRRAIALALSLLAVRDSEELLVRFCGDEDPVIRMNGAQGLGRIRSRQVPALLPLLSDRSTAVRREAARALGLLQQKPLGRPLMRAAESEGEPEVRAALLVAVGQSGDRSLSKELEKFLKSSSESTRVAAARGLCGLGASSGFAFAKGLLSSGDRYQRRQGVALFEGFPAKAVEPALRPLLGDKDKGIAAAAARILYQGGEPRMLDWLVVASAGARGEDKLAIEAELEPLHVAGDQRKAILRKAGIK